MNINKYICTGRLTKDPELRDLDSGKSVCDLRVAVDGMGRGGEVGYINVSVYGKPGEACAAVPAQGLAGRGRRAPGVQRMGDATPARSATTTRSSAASSSSLPRARPRTRTARPSRRRREPVGRLAAPGPRPGLGARARWLHDEPKRRAMPRNLNSSPRRRAARLPGLLLTSTAEPGQFLDVRWRRPAGPMRRRFLPAARTEDAATLFAALGGQQRRVRRRRAARRRPLRRTRGDRRRGAGLHRVRPREHRGASHGVRASARRWWWPRAARVITRSTGFLTARYPAREVESANRRLALALAADPASADAARILRPPGTLNHKHEPPAAGHAAGPPPGCSLHARRADRGLPEDRQPAARRTPANGTADRAYCPRSRPAGDPRRRVRSRAEPAARRTEKARFSARSTVTATRAFSFIPTAASTASARVAEPAARSSTSPRACGASPRRARASSKYASGSRSYSNLASSPMRVTLFAWIALHRLAGAVHAQWAGRFIAERAPCVCSIARHRRG